MIAGLMCADNGNMIRVSLDSVCDKSVNVRLEGYSAAVGLREWGFGHVGGVEVQLEMDLAIDAAGRPYMETLRAIQPIENPVPECGCEPVYTLPGKDPGSRHGRCLAQGFDLLNRILLEVAEAEMVKIARCSSDSLPSHRVRDCVRKSKVTYNKVSVKEIDACK